jgi:hypothetical protein
MQRVISSIFIAMFVFGAATTIFVSTAHASRPFAVLEVSDFPPGVDVREIRAKVLEALEGKFDFSKPNEATVYLRYQFCGIFAGPSWQEVEYPPPLEPEKQDSVWTEVKREAKREAPYLLADLAYSIPKVGYAVGRLGERVAYGIDRREQEKEARRQQERYQRELERQRLTITYEAQKLTPVSYLMRFDRLTPGSEWGAMSKMLTLTSGYVQLIGNNPGRTTKLRLVEDHVQGEGVIIDDRDVVPVMLANAAWTSLAPQEVQDAKRKELEKGEGEGQ